MRLRSAGLAFTILLCHGGSLCGQESVYTCDKISLARPGVGVAYKGTIRNSDYGFSATVPHGLVGWGGVYESAPFHGFMIYLNHEATSCISFYIAIRVDLEGDVAGKTPLDSKPAQIGNRAGLQTSAIGPVGGTRVENLAVFCEYPLEGEKVDVGVTLITPISEEKSAKAALTQFLASFHFR